MTRVIWSPSATRDLRDIKAYLTEHHSEVFAESVIAKLVDAAQWLMDYPNAGTPLKISGWRKWRPRKARHILIYKSDRDTLRIMRVRHEGNDWRPVPLD